MCGIAGCAGPIESGEFAAMLARLAHRGPDDRGSWHQAQHGITLGQTRLSIIDLSPTGHQPMTDASGRYTLVYNGEIYNYRELRAELDSAGVRLRGSSDTEVLLELYARHGADVLTRLNGIFAIAVWDHAQRELLLARDAFGVKPLYFAAEPRRLLFASELKAIAPMLSSRTLDVAALNRYLHFLWCPGEGTPLREVRQLGPGEAMRVRGASITQRWTWYELPARRSTPAPALLSEHEAAPAVRQALRLAVQRQLVADVPVGAFLSGGLDSSAVAAFARESTPDLRCFTIELAGGNDAGFVDDLPYARRVAQRLGVKLDVIAVDAAHMAQDVEQMIWMLDEPLADPAPLNVMYISRLAREHGMKVLLSGAGGDDLFSGYRRHVALRYERLWSWMPAPARRALEASANRMDARHVLSRRAQRLFSSAGASGDERLASYFFWAPPQRLRALYQPDTAAALARQRAEQPLLDFLSGAQPGLPALERMLALEQRFFLTDHNLAYTDRMAMAVGVEARVPFLDVDLVELAARVPERLKQRGRVSKWVLKRAMEPDLPHDVIYRPKTGFGAPLRRWLHGELRPLVNDVLSAAALKRRGLFEPAAVARLITDDAEGRIDAAYTIFSLLAIEVWCRRFVDSSVP
jgi:asparagine synthase (glutamine-hydrolysing)